MTTQESPILIQKLLKSRMATDIKNIAINMGISTKLKSKKELILELSPRMNISDFTTAEIHELCRTWKLPEDTDIETLRKKAIELVTPEIRTEPIPEIHILKLLEKCTTGDIKKMAIKLQVPVAGGRPSMLLKIKEKENMDLLRMKFGTFFPVKILRNLCKKFGIANADMSKTEMERHVLSMVDIPMPTIRPPIPEVKPIPPLDFAEGEIRFVQRTNLSAESKVQPSSDVISENLPKDYRIEVMKSKIIGILTRLDNKTISEDELVKLENL